MQSATRGQSVLTLNQGLLLQLGSPVRHQWKEGQTRPTGFHLHEIHHFRRSANAFVLSPCSDQLPTRMDAR